MHPQITLAHMDRFAPICTKKNDILGRSIQSSNPHISKIYNINNNIGV